MIGLDIRTIYFSEEEYRNFGQFYMKDLLEGKIVKVDHKFKRKNGEMIWTKSGMQSAKKLIDLIEGAQ